MKSDNPPFHGRGKGHLLPDGNPCEILIGQRRFEVDGSYCEKCMVPCHSNLDQMLVCREIDSSILCWVMIRSRVIYYAAVM